MDNKGEMMALGTPGVDQQDQWQLILFLRHVHGVDNLQTCMDMHYFTRSILPHPFIPYGASETFDDQVQ